MKFAKGHGTQNDFVILPDPDSKLELSPERVARLCDRRRGLGADGVLRVARAGALLACDVLTSLPPGVGEDHWFMDYRNADGSIAEMCGNGVRVFAHYLVSNSLVDSSEFEVGSRAGVRGAVVDKADSTEAVVTVSMGPVTILGHSCALIDGSKYNGLAIDVGNPHLACVVEDGDIADLDLTDKPVIDEDLFPAGANVEVFTSVRDGIDQTTTMRVFERGVGETLACGTGMVAVAVAALAAKESSTGVIDVDARGGRVTVEVAKGASYLTGPSVLLAAGEISDRWWIDTGT